MNLYDSLPDAAGTIFGAEAVGSYAHSLLTVDVPTASWIPALEIARDKLGCTYFDWLSAVDEPGTGFRVCAHVVSLENHRVRRLLLRTTVPHSAPSLPSAVAIYAGTEWHERETFEMFGIVFTDHPNLVPLLLPENFEGHPLRKDFVLAARVAKAWPGAKEPGEAHDPDAPKRRQMLPPGVPDPNDWGPMKGQLPPAPARPARTPRAAGAAAAGAAGDRPVRAPREGAPVRRTRSVGEGSASQAAPAATPTDPTTAPATGPADAARPVRRSRSASEGSASQATPAPTDAAAPTPAPAPADAEAPAPAPAAARPPRRTRSASDGSASQAADAADAAGSAPEPPVRPGPRSTDAPWHDPKPAFDTRPTAQATPAAPAAPAEPAASAEPADTGAPAGPAAPAAPAEPADPAAPAAPATPTETADPIGPAETDGDPTTDPTGGTA